MAPVAHIMSSFLLGFALCLLVLAICLNHWRGGNLFNCEAPPPENATKARICGGILITGAVLWTVAFILGLVRFCSSEELIGRRGVGLFYLLTLYVGTLLNVAGVLLYTSDVDKDWSYLLTIVSWTASLVVSVMAAILCRCGTKRT